MLSACQRLLDNCSAIRSCVDLSGVSIAIDDCYDLWDSGFISIPYDFAVEDLRPQLQRLLPGSSGRQEAGRGSEGEVGGSRWQAVDGFSGRSGGRYSSSSSSTAPAAARTAGGPASERGGPWGPGRLRRWGVAPPIRAGRRRPLRVGGGRSLVQGGGWQGVGKWHVLGLGRKVVGKWHV